MVNDSQAGPIAHVRAVMLVFDKAPIMLSAAEHAIHWHVASPE
jgi:hypothetical protein